METKKFVLPESEMPKAWYNIVADMPNKPLPALDPRTKKPVTAEAMNRIFGEEAGDVDGALHRDSRRGSGSV